MPYTDFPSVIERITSSSLDLVDAISAAESFTTAGRRDMAIQIYKIWTRFNPDHPHGYAAHFNCGVLHSDVGELAAAEEALRAALAASPDFAPAHVALGRVLERKGALGEAVARAAPEPPAAAAPAPEAEPVHPLLQLRDCYDQASVLLREPLTVQSEMQVERLNEAARGLSLQVPAGSELAGWEKHYRLALEAIDLSPLRRTYAAPALARLGALAASNGAPLELDAAKARVKQIGARAVFFVAADPSYMETYARAYAASVLQNTDVPSVVLMHVIGGAARLREIARSVGEEDERLLFSGDDFDPAAVATRCYDAPPKGLIPRPVAHYQSARFLKLGAVLRAFERPVFVSDIDLLLQRGVEDLLTGFKAADIVLNKNAYSNNAGSQFTANLLLVNPTLRGLIFSDFLAGYLGEKLAGAEVTRWIDQFGLAMAFQYLSRAGAKAKIEYFDTSRDINNLMFASYVENPYRFFSLYHGFDMSSLEKRQDGRHARVAAE